MRQIYQKSNNKTIRHRVHTTTDHAGAPTRVHGGLRGVITSRINGISIMEESKCHTIHTIQLSNGDAHLRVCDCLPESRALTPNVDNDGTMDYGDLNSEHTEYVIFDCFINLRTDTIEYAKLMDCIIEIFDIEDEQIHILNLTENNLNGCKNVGMDDNRSCTSGISLHIKIYYFQDDDITIITKHSTENHVVILVNIF